jgi:predicted XRE-type DNA-binding protein
MKHERFDSMWDAIEDTPAEAENMKLRSVLMTALEDQIARARLTQEEAARLLGITQPRVSDLVRGRIDRFGLDTLVNLATVAGLHVKMEVVEAKAPEAA